MLDCIALRSLSVDQYRISVLLWTPSPHTNHHWLLGPTTDSLNGRHMRNSTAGADSSKESLLWSKLTLITSPLSSDAVSFFRNVGKSWAQQNLNVVLSFPSRLAEPVEWDWKSECLLWSVLSIVPRGRETFCARSEKSWATTERMYLINSRCAIIQHFSHFTM